MPMSQPQTGAGSRSNQPVVIQIPSAGHPHPLYAQNGQPSAAPPSGGGRPPPLPPSSDQTMVMPSDPQAIQARQLSEDVLRPLKTHLEQGWQAAVKSVTHHLLAAERHKEDQLIAMNAELRRTQEEVQRAHAELHHLRQLDAGYKSKIADLERLLHAANDVQAQHTIAGLQHRVVELEHIIAQRDGMLDTARRALDAAQPSADNVLHMVDIRAQDMQTLALRLEDALHRPTIRAVFDAVRDETFLLFKLVALASLMRPLHEPHPTPLGHIPKDPAAIDAFLVQKLPELEDHFQKIASTAGQPPTPTSAPASAPPGFSGLPRPAHRVRLPSSATSPTSLQPTPEWLKPLSQMDPSQDIAFQAAQQKQAIMHAKRQIGSPRASQQLPTAQRPRSDSQRSQQVQQPQQQQPHPHAHAHAHAQHPPHPPPLPYPHAPPPQAMAAHPPRPQLLPPASPSERPPMLRPAQWDAAHSPVHTRPQPPRRPAPSQPPQPPQPPRASPLPPPQPQRLPAPAAHPPPAPVKVKQEDISDPESERPLTPSPPLNMTPLPSANTSAPRQPSQAPPQANPTPQTAAPLDVLHDPAYRNMVREITADKLRSVWRAAPGTPGKVHCILCAQMRDTGEMPAGREPPVLPQDAPDETRNAHCVEYHKLVWETAIKSEIAERLQGAGEDEDMEDDIDMDLEEGELR